MEKQVDYVSYRAIVDGETGEQYVELVRGQYIIDVIQTQTFDGGVVDPKRNDPTLANFYEPKADDEQGDG